MKKFSDDISGLAFADLIVKLSLHSNFDPEQQVSIKTIIDAQTKEVWWIARIRFAIYVFAYIMGLMFITDNTWFK